MSATQKMIDYARGIASVLKLPEPDFTDFNETSAFISNFCDEYKRIKKLQTNERILEETCDSIQHRFHKTVNTQFIKFLDTLSGVQGVYVFYNAADVVYIGKSLDLKYRILGSLEERMPHSFVTDVGIIECERTADMHILEIVLITEFKPLLNKDCTCKDFSKHFQSGIDLKTMQRNKLWVMEEV